MGVEEIGKYRYSSFWDVLYEINIMHDHVQIWKNKLMLQTCLVQSAEQIPEMVKLRVLGGTNILETTLCPKARPPACISGSSVV